MSKPGHAIKWFFHVDTPHHLHYTGFMLHVSQKIYLVILLAMLAACTPPTPPPSPTPWPTPTPMPVQVSPTPQAAATLPPATSTPTPRPTNASSGATITVWESLPEAQAQLLAQQIDDFQAQFPQYLVTVQHYNSPEDFMTPLMANQTGFDVVLASPGLLTSLRAADRIAPMSDFFPPSFIDGFAAVTLLGASQDNAVWGLPDTTGFHLLLFYNKDLVDTPPATTAELAELAQPLTKGAQWGLGVNSYDPLWLVPWLAPYGGWLTDEAGRPTLDTPAMESALTLYLGWQGRLTGIAPVATYGEVRSKFLSGDVAMMIDGDWAIGELSTTDEINWGVAPLPNVGQPQDNQPAAPLVLSRYWAVSRAATGSRALAAAAFLEFLTQPERQLEKTRRFGLLPTRRSALDNPLIVNDPVWRVSAAQMQAGRAVPPGVNANLLLDAMRRPLQRMIDGELTPQAAAKMMQANARP